MGIEIKKLSLIAPEERGSKEYFGYHREAVLDAVFGGGVAVEEMFKVLNDKDLTLDSAKAFFAEHYEGNDKMMIDGRDLFLLNRYINDYVGVPLFYDKNAAQPVNNTVGDYVVDFLIDVKGWAKVQDRIYTSDPESYRRFFDYACKGYYIDLRSYALKYDFLEGKFVSIDNNRRAYMYHDDKELCDRMASELSSARTTFFRDAVLRDTERKIRLREEETKETDKVVHIDQSMIQDGVYRREPQTSQETPTTQAPAEKLPEQ